MASEARDGGDAAATDARDATVDTTPPSPDVQPDVNAADVQPDVAAQDVQPDVNVPDVALDVPAAADVQPDVNAPDLPVDVQAPDIQPTTYTVGGTITGLTGTGLVLRNNGGDNLTVPANATTFTFATRLTTGSAYAVTVLTQPSGPTQICTVTNGTGVVAVANVTNVSIACVTQTFTVGGTIAGLTGTGLVLRNNGVAATDLTITAGATTFTFAAPVASGGPYAVTVQTQPNGPTQVCTVANASGTVGAANVTNVTVTCATAAFSIGGTVSGLTAAGLVLRNNASAATDLAVPANATTFTFVAQVASGGAYNVTVQAQPTGLTCTVTNGTGTVASANVTNVAVACVPSQRTVGGTIAGLTATSTGLVLRNAVGGGGNVDFTVPAGATTTFTLPQQPNGTTYAVTVLTNPSNPSQTCTVGNGTGTANANVTNVTVTCVTSMFAVGGTITGLLASNTNMVLRNTISTGAPLDLNVPNGATTAFTFPTQPNGSTYSVQVLNPPGTPAMNCTVTNASGTITNANVTNVMIACTPAVVTRTVGGTIAGLTATSMGLVLRNAVGGGGNVDLAIPAGAQTTFTFPAQPNGTTYAVTVLTNPNTPAATCTVTNGTGTANANVTNVVVTCTTTPTTVTTCDANEPELATLDLDCGAVLFIRTINFANFGQPTGACPAGPFAEGAACPEIASQVGMPNSFDVISAMCLGLHSCSVSVDTVTTGPFIDPCPGLPKTATAQVTCAP